MDQVRGGGAGGALIQSGGSVASRLGLIADAMDMVRQLVIRKPTVELPHFFKHAAASGHFDLLSQHSQSAAPVPLPAFSQSVIVMLSLPLALMAMLARAAAHADTTGATVSDTLMTNNRRRRM